jgi:undecaprenyl-diphosphatase
MFWEDVHHIDQLVTLEINSWDSPITDPIWQFFSDKLVWAPMYAAIIALLIWKLGWKKGLLVLAGALLTFGFCDQFSNLIKHAVERIRPLHDEFMVSNGLNILEKGGGYSFFSAHSANSFGLAFSTYIGMKRCLMSQAPTQGLTQPDCQAPTPNMPKWLKAYGYWMFFWAFMVAVSRIFVGKHYLGDVIVGTIVGIVIGCSLGIAASIISKSVFRK